MSIVKIISLIFNSRIAAGAAVAKSAAGSTASRAASAAPGTAAAVLSIDAVDTIAGYSVDNSDDFVEIVAAPLVGMSFVVGKFVVADSTDLDFAVKFAPLGIVEKLSLVLAFH